MIFNILDLHHVPKFTDFSETIESEKCYKDREGRM